VAASVFNLAVSLESLGLEQRFKQAVEFSASLDDAEKNFSLALSVFESKTPRPPEVAVCMRRLYQVLWNRGKIEMNMAKLLAACAVYRRALALDEEEKDGELLAQGRLSFCRLLLDALLLDEAEEQCQLAKVCLRRTLLKHTTNPLPPPPPI